jgi:methylenetetrahydrofolate reductase (NADPH)
MTPSQPVARPQQRIADLLCAGGPSFSFEFFPPRSDAAARALARTVAELAPLNPAFVSVTYGAGGSTRALTLETVGRLSAETGITVMAHLTCVGHDRAELRRILADLRRAGVRNLMALRGDPPRGEATFVPPADGFAHADELIRFIRTEGFDFCIGAACYPEGHLESEDRAQDLAYVQRKVAAGAEFLITQLFYDNAFYFDFLRRARAIGMTVPIIPGIMPITDVAQVQRITRLCGATIPIRLQLQLERCETADEVFQVGLRWAIAQCRELLAGGAPGIHFYTLNRSPATRRILEAIRGA